MKNKSKAQREKKLELLNKILNEMAVKYNKREILYVELVSYLVLNNIVEFGVTDYLLEKREDIFYRLVIEADETFPWVLWNQVHNKKLVNGVVGLIYRQPDNKEYVLMRELQELRSQKQIITRTEKQQNRASVDIGSGVVSKQLEQLSKTSTKRLN